LAQGSQSSSIIVAASLLLAAMRCYILLAGLLGASAQYHSYGFLHRRGGDSAVSSSYFSSSSWSQGSDGQIHKDTKETRWFQGMDGQMHKETKQTQSDLVQDQYGRQSSTQSKIVCHDGRCREVVMVGSQPSNVMQEEPAMPIMQPMFNRPALQSGRMPPRLQAMLERLMGSMEGQQQPQIIVRRPEPPTPMVNQAVLVDDPRGPFMRMGNPFSRPAYEQSTQATKPSWGRVTMLPFGVAKPVQKQAPHYAPGSMTLITFITFSAATLGLCTAVAVVTMILRCRHSDARESARDRPLRALAEPLAPEQVSEKSLDLPQAAPVQSRMYGIPMYLSRLYVNANAASESRLVRKLMSRVYSRAVQ